MYLSSSFCYYPDSFGRDLTQIRIIQKPHAFLYEKAFRPHEPSEFARRNHMFVNTSSGFFLSDAFGEFVRGTQRELIVRNQLNIALLNEFQYLNGRYRQIFIPLKFFICSDFLAESYSSDPKIKGIKHTFSKISARKKSPEDSR